MTEGASSALIFGAVDEAFARSPNCRLGHGTGRFLGVNITSSSAASPAVQNVQANGVVADDANLSWEAFPNAVKYRIYWSLSADMPATCEPNCVVVTPNAGPSYSLKTAIESVVPAQTVSTGSTYYVKISGVSSAGKTVSSYSAPLTVDLEGDPPPVTPTGNIGGTLTTSPAGGVTVGDAISITANFSSTQKSKTVTFYQETATPGDYLAIGTVKSNSSGDATLTNHVVAANEKYFARVDALETNVVAVTAATPNADGHIVAFSSDGKTVTAQFDTPASGAATRLEMQRIVTTETDEVNSTNPADPADTSAAPWVTVASSTQNASGATTFKLSGAYPYRVSHNYRARSVATTTPTMAFGLGQVAPKSSGLSALYFNTNENHAVDTRTHYFEGEFAMSASSNFPGCTDVGYTDASKRLKNSTMKGRGNYSWSFPRKSFTLKLGKSTDLCGMGKSKKWALVSNDYDKSFMRNSLAGYLGYKFTNMAWTPKSTPVDLYLNGSYRGNYLLIERITPTPRGSMCPSSRLMTVTRTAMVSSRRSVRPRTPLTRTTPIPAGPAATSSSGTSARVRTTTRSLGSDSGYVGVKDPRTITDREATVTDEGHQLAAEELHQSYLNTVDRRAAR